MNHGISEEAIAAATAAFRSVGVSARQAAKEMRDFSRRLADHRPGPRDSAALTV